MSSKDVFLNDDTLIKITRQALEEDIGSGDITTMLIDSEGEATAHIITNDDCIIAGLILVEKVFKILDQSCMIEFRKKDGELAYKGEIIATIKGKIQAILSGERTALNFLQRLSGIATRTSLYVNKTKPYGVIILDTRKTTPGLRIIEKYAVKCGGGENHRFGLFDRILIKDNHKVIFRRNGIHKLADIIKLARNKYPDKIIEIEIEKSSELIDALEGNPDWVLLDNMTPEEVARCVKIIKKKAKIEVSGNITLSNICYYARLGIDAISVGAITHSAPTIDISMEIV